MKIQVLCLFAKEKDEECWFLWYAMSEASYEAGDEFPDLEECFETREVWVEIDDDAIQAALCAPKIEAKISPNQ